MNAPFRALIALTLFVLAASPVHAHAFEVSGWIPYWAIEKGTKTASSNLSAFTELNPFAYSVRSNGTLADTANIKKSDWKRLFTSARNSGVAIIPTVMWSDKAAIDKILKDSTLRAAHVKNIAAMVNNGSFDGVDIDYENKGASTRTYFSLFLKELKTAIGDKTLACTIEARTPPDSLYRTIPANLEYANDYKEINKYCDRVRIMTYDQQTADWKLNAAASGPYAPLSDTAWVKKVMDLAAKDISKSKLVMGIPTYGHEYEITVSPTGGYSYKKLWAFNPKYATDLARKQNVTPTRGASGEMGFAYLPKNSPAKKTKVVALPNGVAKSETALAQAQAYAKASGKSTVVNMLWWSDAGAISQKITLAKSLGLAGVAIFKVDGSADSGMWKLLK